MPGPAVATLRTARLLLRPPGPGDAAKLAEAIGNYDVARWLGQVPYPYRIEDAERFIARAVAGRTWLIDAAGVLVGGISADHELGYWLARPAWGRGIATEACDVVVDAAFGDPGRAVLASGHYAGNDRSARVLIKQGFVYTGETLVAARALSQEVASRNMELDRAAWQARRHYRVSTPRLMIREIHAADLQALMAICGQQAVARMLFNIPHPWPETAARAWLDAARYRGRPGFRAAICRGGAMIGIVGILRLPGRGTLSAMYAIDPAHAGQGYATEALVHVLNDAMARFHIDTIWADHFEDNPASGAVLRNAGFTVHRAGTGLSAARRGEHPVTIYRLDRGDLVRAGSGDSRS